MNSNLGKIGLGTAQWGLSYGVSNQSGKTMPDEVARILDYARVIGIEVIDTARAYGNAEQVLGMNDLTKFKVISKVPPLETLDKARGFSRLSLEDSLHGSLYSLGLDRIYGLLLHSTDDLFSQYGPSVLSALQVLKASGRVNQIGVSVYNSSQVKRVLEIFKPDIVQVPLNVFDQRLLWDGTLSNLKKLGIEIHARSIFLQGLLLMKAEDMPSYFRPWQAKFASWNRLCTDLGAHPQHVALDFVFSSHLVDQVIIGVENVAQLKQLTSFKYGNYDRHLFAKCISRDECLLNPSLWTL